MKKLIFIVVFLFCNSAYASDPTSWTIDVPFDNLTGWTDGDTGNAVSQINPAGYLEIDTNTHAATNQGIRTKDLGTYNDQVTVEYRLKFDSNGGTTDDRCNFAIYGTGWVGFMRIYGSNLEMYDTGSGFTEVGTDVILSNTYQVIRILYDFSGAAGAGTCDVYVNRTLVGDNIPCEWETSGTNGTTQFVSTGQGTADDNIYHVDYFRAVNGLYTPDPLTIDNILSYTVFQRDASGYADIALSGTYAEGATSIEAQVVKTSDDSVVVDWTAVDSSLADLVWSGTINNVTEGPIGVDAGWYKVNVRWGNDVSKTDVSNYFGVGPVICLWGQSNMQLWNYPYGTPFGGLYPDADLEDNQCQSFSSPTTWTDIDNINGVSSIVSSQWDFNSGVAAANNKAGRSRDVGSIPSTFTVEFYANIVANGGAANDNLRIIIYTADAYAFMNFYGNNVEVADTDSGNTEIGTNLAQIGTTQFWRFSFDFSGAAGEGFLSSAYLDGVLVAENVPAEMEIAGTDGTVQIDQVGVTTAGNHAVFYYFRVYSGLYDTDNEYVRLTSGTSWMPTVGKGAGYFGNLIYDALQMPVGIIYSPVGASALIAAYDTGNGYWNGGALYTAALADIFATTGGYDAECICWGQGENEALGSCTEADYEASLIDFVGTDVKTDVRSNIIFLVSGLGRETDAVSSDAVYDGIRNAQWDAIASVSGMYMGSTAMDFTLQDVHHFDVASIKKNAIRMAQTYLYVIGEETYSGLGPKIRGWQQVDNNTLRIKLTPNGGTDITPASGITGFVVYDDAATETISAVTQESTTALLIDISGTFTGTPDVTYQAGRNPTVTTPCYDNTAEALPIYMYKTIDKVSSGKVIIINSD